MILGNVNDSREAIVQLAVLGQDQKYQMVKAVVDTGYTGCLILPMAVIASMGLKRLRRSGNRAFCRMTKLG
jgi:predicted aspartyl protease